MSNPLHAPYYADGACWAAATIVENVKVARDTFRVRFECPKIAARVTPRAIYYVAVGWLRRSAVGKATGAIRRGIV